MAKITLQYQGQPALLNAFTAIASHCGGDMVALDKLSDLEGLVLRFSNMAINSALNVACPATTTLAAFLSGALETANGGKVPGANLSFTLTTAQDTSDTAFATAKGSAPAIGDTFVVNANGSSVSFVASSLSGLDTALQPYTYRGAVIGRE